VSAHFAGWDRRTLELALDEVTFGLAPGDRRELLTRADARSLEELELAVAELSVAALGELESPPAELTRRIAADARAWLAAPDPARPAPPPAVPVRTARVPRWAAAGWLAAALVLALFVLERVRARPLDPSQRRAELVAGATDLVRAQWKASDDPLAGGVSGEVVWSSARQEGYMSFRSLPSNDPARNQYQLWIFDPTRADWEARPVDGGVFDVGPGEEVVVPVEAKLEVRRAVLFALTLEAPGGVVVSAREHLLATATP
jgi:hypothetical protein